MKTYSIDNKSGIQHERNSVWGGLKVLVSLFLSLETLFKLTEVEKQDAGIHIEHQGE